MNSKVASYTPQTGLVAKVARRLVQYRTAAPISADFHQSVVSFSFDDFPATAATAGSEVLERHGARGTFYAATGLLGRDSVSGRVATAEEIAELAERGHEIGAHSHGHADAAKAGLDGLEADLATNLDTLQQCLGDRPIRSYAYPYGETQMGLKRKLASRFDTSRGILSGINRKGSDRMQLRAVELSPEPWRLEKAYKLLDAVAQRPGWIVFFTHDVSDTPSAYGITPDTLDALVSEVTRRGIEIRPVGEVAVR